MWINYLKVAFRNFKRHRAFSSINIFGLALGMACCLVVVLFVQEELSYDRFHENSEKIFRISDEIQRPAGVFMTIRIPIWIGPSLVQDFPEVEDACRLVRWGGIVSSGEKRFEAMLFFSDSSFLKIFSFPLLSGDKNNALADPNNIIITRQVAEKYFGDNDAVGRILTVDGQYEFKVAGVLADIPRNSHIKFDFLAPLDHVRHIYSDERYRNSRVMAYTYLLLDSEAASLSLQEKIKRFITDHKGADYAALHKFSLQPLTSIHLQSHTEIELERDSRISKAYILSAVALLILLIACVNYINLSTARASCRALEVGVRKVIGADRRQLFQQFMGDSMLLSFLALILALALVQFFLPAFNSLMDRNVAMDFRGNPFLYLEFIGIALLVGFASGSYPALFLASFRPIDVLKGKKERHRMTGLFIRKGLVVFQFILAIVFITGTLLVDHQLDYIRNRDLGFDKEQILVLPPPVKLEGGYQAFKSELLDSTHILDVTASTDIPGRSPGIPFSFIPEEGTEDDVVPLNYMAVDFDFINFYGMEIIEGRSFSKAILSDMANAYILNESAVKKLGWESAVGKQLREEGGESSGRVIGVVKDFHNVSLHEKIQPSVYQVEPQMFGMVAVRIAPGKTKEALDFLKKKWS
jgi:putative ABC transport system permease protein